MQVRIRRLSSDTPRDPDPGFTLRRYVHLLDTDLPEPTVLAAVGNERATRHTETDRDADLADTVEVAV